jgi:hypothetical protein
MPAKRVPPHTMPERWDDSADVVIVGCGYAGAGRSAILYCKSTLTPRCGRGRPFETQRVFSLVPAPPNLDDCYRESASRLPLYTTR